MKILNLNERLEILPTIAVWLHRKWGHIRDRSLDDIVKILNERCSSKDEFILVALIDDIPVGTASMRKHDMDILQELSPWLSSVYVPEEHRRKGIASALVREVENQAKARGFERMYLFTVVSVPLYEELGWTHMRSVEYLGKRVFVMEKRIV